MNLRIIDEFGILFENIVRLDRLDNAIDDDYLIYPNATMTIVYTILMTVYIFKKIFDQEARVKSRKALLKYNFFFMF